ncbi:PTS sugar transporter subunit IIA [Clostridium intestinale]|uniref:PTS system, glucose subfamily, IIA component n=1 Tax=Clostridium intestinale DSM 6191 TaxID=1121320 RepID=A0A1M5WMI1_9CLOT|nr:PTS glucose transporter subunit IIA [Clostridium intestinale]SHH88775.1 PTS system, glucose subfamily, IIA component [Clostridium intestinale DSM 6191]
MKVVSPIDGEMKLLNDVNDEAFASKMMGDGIAVTPSNGIVYAPVSGEITMLFPTNHALGIKTKEGVELLIHIGIDTVELNGRGFTGLVKQGDVVDIGDKLIEFDVDLIKNLGYESDIMIIITNTSDFNSINYISKDTLKHGDYILEIM